MSVEYKIIFLYFKKSCTYIEISDILDLDIKFIAKVVAVELCEIERQSLNMLYYTPIEYSDKVKLNQICKNDL
jgi:hypothetical protein